MPFFLFQAEDGIRDRTVTGVQTCALPILVGLELRPQPPGFHAHDGIHARIVRGLAVEHFDSDDVFFELIRLSTHGSLHRSEERRVGKECRSRWWRYRRTVER